MSGSDGSAKLFTVDEANALLPEIRSEVEEMLRIFRAIRAEIEAAAQGQPPTGAPDLPRRLEERGIAPRLFREARAIIDRIHSRGCLVNGPEAGLVDFPCLLGSEIVFLCWKFGEPLVAHWHRIPEGFAGRRPLLDPTDGAPTVH
jgi:hypothetical protein